LKPPIRVLHLEDSPRDAALVADLLGAAAIHCEFIPAASRKEFEAALEQTAFDLILCDYNLPEFDGLSALKLAKASFPDTPVIVVSGAIDAEEAVQCLKAGATDYLLKQRLERLPSAVKHAVDQAEKHFLHRQAEQRLTQERELGDAILNNMPGLFYLIAEDGRFLRWNHPFETVSGYSGEEVAQMHLLDFFACEHKEEVAARILQVFQTGRSEVEAPFITKQGARLPFFFTAGSVVLDGQPCLAGMGIDISERKNIERQLLRAQRLESIGTLAGGIAHDLNNTLTPILMGVELLKKQYPNESIIVDHLESSAKRGADMVRLLLNFAKGADGERALIQPARLVKELENLMRSSFPKNIRFLVACGPDLPLVRGDATQLHQVLLNLCVNARDAMPNGGTLTLEVEKQDLNSAYASSVPGAMPGEYLMLRVRDVGTGIPPDILDRIFDPFFSTKGPDKGTGLGLSTAMGIVKGHRGFLQVDSQLGQGSTFAVYLPADSGEETDLPNKPAPTFQRRGDALLLVDEKAAVRQMARGGIADGS
jgi:PAS domain S-box-containing protein